MRLCRGTIKVKWPDKVRNNEVLTRTEKERKIAGNNKKEKSTLLLKFLPVFFGRGPMFSAVSYTHLDVYKRQIHS